MQAAKPEQSTFSRSTTGKEELKSKKSLIDGESQVIDKLFPLIHELQKEISIKPGFYLMMMIGVIFQICAKSLWQEYKWQFHIDTPVGRVLAWIVRITLFTPLTFDANGLLIRLILFAILAVSFVAMLAFQSRYYSVNRRFIRWTLGVSRIYFEFVPVLCLVPCGNYIGESLYLAITTKSTIIIAYFVVGLVFYAIFIMGHYIMTYLFATTVYIPHSPNASWSGFLHFFFIFMAGVFAIIGWMTNFFVYWTAAVVIAIKMAYDIYIMYRLVWLPFSQLESNAIVASLHFVLFILDMFALIQFFGIYIDYMYHAIFFFVSFIVGMGITKNTVQMTVKKVRFNLSEEALENIELTEEMQAAHELCNMNNAAMCLTDARKRQLFLNIGLHRSYLRSMLYLRIGIATGAPLFIDWSLIKFVAEYHNSAEMMATITQLICYFPCESRLLSYFFNATIMMPKLKIGHRFIIYQVHRVKDIRQSSASSDITEKLIELKNKTAGLVTTIKNYWVTVPKDISLLYEIQKNTTDINHLYSEALAKWPNNVRLTEDYSYFLIECASQYTDGLKMKYRADLIEQGKSFIVDHCYRSLVRSYPFYLTKNIMDTAGNFINKGIKKGGGGGSSSNSSASSSQMSFSLVQDLDAEVEDSLGKASFSFPKLRIAYQKSLENRKSKNNQLLKSASFLSMITAVALNLFLFIWFFNKFTFRATNMQRQFIMNEVRFGYDAALVTLSGYLNIQAMNYISEAMYGDCHYGMAALSPRTNNHNLHWCEESHPFPPTLGNESYPLPTNYKLFTNAFIQEIQRWDYSSRDKMYELVHSVEVIAATLNVDDDIAAFVRNIVPFDFCIFNASISGVMGINRTQDYNLQQILVYSLMQMNLLTQVRYYNSSDWAERPGVCEAFINLKGMYDAFDSVSLNLSNAQFIQKKKVQQEDMILLIVVCVVFLCIWMPVLLVIVSLVLREIHFVLNLMSNIDKKSKEEASKQIKIGFVLDDQGTLTTTSNKKSISAVVLSIFILFFIAFALIVFVVIIQISDDKNTHFLILNRYLFYGIKRGNFMIEVWFFTFLVVFSAQHDNAVPMINSPLLTSMIYDMLGLLTSSNNNLLRGANNDIDNEDLPPCIGLDPELDNIHFKNQCPPGVTSDYTGQPYSCMSLDAGISLFNVYITDMMANPFNNTVDINSTMYYAFNMVNNYMLDPAYEAAEILSNLAQDAIDEYQMVLAVITFVAIFVHFLIFALLHGYLKKIDVAFDGAFHLMRRLPPLSINSNPLFLNFLLKKKEEEVVTKMSPCQAAIMNSKDSVLFLGKSESIELVNKAVAGIFGYTPDQLLGQPLSTIIPAEENPKIFEQLGFMRNGEVPLIFETTAFGVTDDEQQVPVNITILGTSDVHGKHAESFVVIMRDVSHFLKQQKEAEAAKVQSESLLYQILPRDIVVRLNRGEVDISFVVPSSTVIFLDIVKFSDYASNLTPAQIMENLSSVFAAFDTNCAKYNLITKIKLIGDVYMAAAGLFTPDEAPSAHANQVVQFGLDCLVSLEEVNSALDSSLQVRIGVNTDGPLIAGVLGTDKPVFDIIGDPINVSARLQSTGIPGTVQISQKTYDLISNMGFNIEPRGEIMLKGKGKQQAYIVRQKDVSSFFMMGNQNNQNDAA